MQRNIEDQNHLGYQEFEALRKIGMVVEGEIPGIREIESVVIFDGLDNNRREVNTKPQVMLSGIGRSRRAVTVFIPDRKTLEELMQS